MNRPFLYAEGYSKGGRGAIMPSASHRYLKRSISPATAVIAVLLILALVFIVYKAFNTRRIIAEPTATEKALRQEMNKAIQQKGGITPVQRGIMRTKRQLPQGR